MSRTMTPGRAVTLLVAILVAVLLTIVYTLLSTMAEAGTPPLVVGSVLVLALALLWYGKRSSPTSGEPVRSTLDAPRPEMKDDLD